MSDRRMSPSGQTDQAMVRVESGSAQELTWLAWPADQFSAPGPSAAIYHLPSPGVPAGPHFPRMGQIQTPV